MERGQRWLEGSDAHWDAHYAVYARHLAPGLCDLDEQERNVRLFTPADVVGGGAGEEKGLNAGITETGR